MALHHILKDIPDDRILAVNYLLCGLHSLHDTALDELADNERLVKLCCHILRKTALVHIELRSYDDN